MRFETRAVHAGGDPDPATGAIAPPLHFSTTFEHGPAGEPRPAGHIYIRESNPTQSRLEEALAAIEGGEAALAFASGVGAGCACLQALDRGAHILFHRDLYYAFRTMALEYVPRWGMEASFVDMTDLDALEHALRPNTQLVWTESPTNPTMQVLDLRAIAALSKGAGALLLVDGTFATPALQRPLELGADVVLHSTTKYLGGHSDVHGGALAFRSRGELAHRVQHNRHILGAVASPFASWMVLRGIRTLACRVERQSANALAVARALEGKPGHPLGALPGSRVGSRPRGGEGADERVRGDDVAADRRRARGGRSCGFAREALPERDELGRCREPAGAPPIGGEPGLDDAGRSHPRLDRARAPGRSDRDLRQAVAV
jgi:cystathionine gamma-synthase